MANLNPLRREDLPQYEEMFATMEQRAGFVPNAFLTMARRPGHARRAAGADPAGLRRIGVARDEEPRSRLMSSYGAGCRYCQAHQATSLMHQGIGEEKMADVADFERSEHFTDAERAAMRLGVRVGSEPERGDAGPLRRASRALRRRRRSSRSSASIAMFGFLNRWHETMATDLEDAPLACRSTGARRSRMGAGATRGES